ncbi:SAP domain-containing ribonucleo isoform X1 [Pelobates cultripes]|uniref:SAP domain-containing ribonucleo isoform X1 n=1 Tax=Pelobates cultripes TaxID=61616 RepID=A0AAD1VR13_PELCU|nr:SAP domain-containing ribonucleo isoform X1 [Pelobates cultripes]
MSFGCLKDYPAARCDVKCSSQSFRITCLQFPAFSVAPEHRPGAAAVQAEEAAEEDVLGDETEEEEQKPSDAPVKEEETPSKPEEKDIDKKLVKIVAGIPQVDRLQKRAERFNVPATVDSKKVARAIRFGLPSTENTGKSTDVLTTVNIDKLKERAQRFGLSVSPVTKKTENDEKLKKRKERFGIVTSSASVTDDVEAKKRKRAERFGMV